MNIREERGITLTTLVITIVVLLIISGVSITGTIRGLKESEDAKLVSELNIVQHAILERYTKSQLTKEELPGISFDKAEIQSIITEIDSSITLKGSEYRELNSEELEKLGISKTEDTYIVNYKTGEVFNKTQKTTKSGKILYIYAKEEAE